MKKKSHVLRNIIIIVCIAAVIGGICFFVYRNNKAQPVNVYPVSLLNESYWGDDTESLQATVTSGSLQEIRLEDSLIEAVYVEEGDTVKKGDVLMKYDLTSYQLNLQSAETRIALLESQLRKSERELDKYRTLQPAEYMPEGWEEVIDNGPLETKETLTADDLKADTEFNCTIDSVIGLDFLKALRKKAEIAYINLYDDNMLYGMITVDGSEIPKTVDIYEPYVPEAEASAGILGTEGADEEMTDDPSGETEPGGEPSEAPTPEPSEEPTPEPTEEPTPEPSEEPTPEPSEEPTPEPSEEPTPEPSITVEPTPEPTPTPVITPDPSLELFVRRRIDPLTDDWRISDIIEYNGEEAELRPDPDHKYLCTFEAMEKEEYERYETVYNFDETDYGENYLYTREELSEMITEKEKEIREQKLDLKEAKVEYDKALITGKTGEVTAGINGTVTEVLDVSECATGDTIIKIKGDEDYIITIFVSEMDLGGVHTGNRYEITAYESGVTFSAAVKSIGTTPASGFYSYNDENPNNSYYPIAAVAEDQELELSIDESCEAVPEESGAEGTGDSIYLPVMYIRSDDRGSYVMKSENDVLTKCYIRTGKTIWGSVTEVRSGISISDYIAFPYGKTVREGSPAVKTEDMNYYW